MGFVLKIWGMGLEFGIHYHIIRDLGSHIADLWSQPTEDLIDCIQAQILGVEYFILAVASVLTM